jgi:hypothetical protein
VTHFAKPGEASSEGYVSKQPFGLSLVRLADKQSRELALVGGVGNDGKPLWVSSSDRTSLSCPVALTELVARGEERRFKLTAVSPGSTTVEARQGGASGTLQDSVLIEVAASASSVVRSGPRLGRNGDIPPALRTKLQTAIDAAWRLNDDPQFVETFRDVVATLSGTPKPITVYAETLNRSVIHLLDTTRDVRVQRGLAAERRDVRDHAVSGVAPSYSFRLQPDIWIRRSAFDKGTRQLTSCILHEAAHVAGARGDPLAEIARDKLHNTAGLPR